MSSRGFGKPEKSKSPRIKRYVFQYVSTDEFVNIVQIKAPSRELANKEFERFVSDLEFSLSAAANGLSEIKTTGGDS
jgi:predicted TIM-barrel fold metal-dependent hydrolase